MIDRIHVLLWKTEKLLFWQLTVNELEVVVCETFTGNLNIWLTQRVALFGSLPISILLSPQNLLYNLACYHVLLRYSCSSRGCMWHFKLYTPRMACSSKLVMILGIVLNVNDFLAKGRRKAYFSTVFFIADEFVHCIKSHLRVILLFSNRLYLQWYTMKINNRVMSSQCSKFQYN